MGPVSKLVVHSQLGSDPALCGALWLARWWGEARPWVRGQGCPGEGRWKAAAVARIGRSLLYLEQPRAHDRWAGFVFCPSGTKAHSLLALTSEHYGAPQGRALCSWLPFRALRATERCSRARCSIGPHSLLTSKHWLSREISLCPGTKQRKGTWDPPPSVASHLPGGSKQRPPAGSPRCGQVWSLRPAW